MDLYSEVKKLLTEIGPGRMRSTAYDTAWVARLVELDEPIGFEALDWLRENQLPDGSWGAKAPHYHHDRLICTLAAVSVLSRWGDDKDRNRLLRARLGLDTAIKGLPSDTVGETIGFEMIIPTLLNDAKEMGVIRRKTDGFADLPLTIYRVNGSTKIKRKADNVLDRLIDQRIAKIGKLPKGKINRNVTVAFSSEMVGTDGIDILDFDNLQEPNGSVYYSPSATAYFALYANHQDPSALNYLNNLANRNLIDNSGGMPTLSEFDIFEPAWTLWNFSITDIINDELQLLCDPHLDFLAKSWKPSLGVGFTANSEPTDSDDTCVTFETLSRYNRQIDVKTVLSYEVDEYFYCNALESNPSISANIHVLSALREVGFDADHPTQIKVKNFLNRSKLFDMFWFDKWHVSPYYPTAHAIIACAGYMDSLVDQAISWIIETQNQNGSWGYYLPTAEETAYCLQALYIWRQNGGDVPQPVLLNGVKWLLEQCEPPYPPMWISKSLYCPELVIRSAILSALILAEQNSIEVVA